MKVKCEYCDGSKCKAVLEDGVYEIIVHEDCKAKQVYEYQQEQIRIELGWKKQAEEQKLKFERDWLVNKLLCSDCNSKKLTLYQGDLCSECFIEHNKLKLVCCKCDWVLLQESPWETILNDDVVCIDGKVYCSECALIEFKTKGGKITCEK